LVSGNFVKDFASIAEGYMTSKIKSILNEDRVEIVLAIKGKALMGSSYLLKNPWATIRTAPDTSAGPLFSAGHVHSGSILGEHRPAHLARSASSHAHGTHPGAQKQ
jgi:hypothetical protein